MCIIASKPAGVEMPRAEYIRNMFKNNGDGAGLMYAANDKVYIEKGFMNYESFLEKLSTLDDVYDLKKLPLVMHFRITTHGGTKPENCHPFPVTESEGMLKKLRCSTDVGVAHNGIIDITPRKGISDTMEYIISQLAPLKRAVPKFYENKWLLKMIYNAIDSKMVIMNNKGQMTYIGEFKEESGVKYSNTSYAYSYKYSSFPYSCYGYDDEELYGQEEQWYYECKDLMYVNELDGEYVTNYKDEIVSGDYAIDKNGYVYAFSDALGMFTRMYTYHAWDASGDQLIYNPLSEWIDEEIVAL